jgi:hypothetical protein
LSKLRASVIEVTAVFIGAHNLQKRRNAVTIIATSRYAKRRVAARALARSSHLTTLAGTLLALTV